jgi:hypothetical protein
MNISLDSALSLPRYGIAIKLFTFINECDNDDEANKIFT